MSYPAHPLPALAAGFIGQRPDGSPAWTLTTCLGHFLAEAECLLGPRDRSWTVLGVEFFGDRPCTWFPGDRRHLAVRLSLSAAHDPKRALFQLAHETVHLLAPVQLGQATVLEEGLAAWFADQQSHNLGLDMVDSTASYRDAATLAAHLVTLWPEAIRQTRHDQPVISEIAPEQLLKAAPGLDPAKADALCRRFSLKVINWGAPGG